MTHDELRAIERATMNQGRGPVNDLPDGAGIVLALVFGLSFWAALATIWQVFA